MNTPEFKKVTISDYGNERDLIQRIVEVIGSICFLPISGEIFMKCIKILTGEDYKQTFSDFISDEKGRSNVMTIARIQSFCMAKNIYIGFYNGIETSADLLQKEIKRCIHTITNFI